MGSDGKCGRIERRGRVERGMVSLYIRSLYCLSCVRVAQMGIVGMKRGQSRYGVHYGGLSVCMYVNVCRVWVQDACFGSGFGLQGSWVAVYNLSVCMYVNVCRV